MRGPFLLTTGGSYALSREQETIGSAVPQEREPDQGNQPGIPVDAGRQTPVIGVVIITALLAALVWAHDK